jgi:exonuclease III
MKVISWNCQGAFRNKYKIIDDYAADIYVIQECENPKQSNNKNYEQWAKNYLWIGDNKSKGIGIFAKSNINIQYLNWSNVYQGHEVKYFLPCSVNNSFNLINVWNHYNNSPNFGYIGQFWKYLQINKSNFKNSLIVGDFNSNTIWDEWDRWWNHSDVVRELKEIEIESLYHNRMKENQGQETINTFFLHKDINKGYHIDYCFASKEIFNKVDNFSIEPYEKWRDVSDHSPIITNLIL